MNRYLAKLASLHEKRADHSNLQNPQNHPMGRVEGFDDPPTVALESATPPTELSAGRIGSALSAVGAECPNHVPEDCWHQAVADAQAFIPQWRAQAEAFGWTARELFGLHTPPAQPAANYCRFSRYDQTGLIWLLRGRPVIALTETTAAIQGATGVLTYRKLNKPPLGPLGDSLDDIGPT